MTKPTQLFIVWIATAVVLGALLGLAEKSRHPKDDPDQAQQRPGFLLDANAFKSPQIISGEPRDGHRMIVFFARSLEGKHLFQDLADQSDLTNVADIIVVTEDASRPMIAGGIRHFATDQNGAIAAAFGLNRPRDGGAPVGYVIVDSNGFIRYRTLDPTFMQRAQKIKIMLEAVP